MSDRLRHALYAPARWLWRRRDISPPIDAASVRHVLVLRYDAIGDMIVTLPMIDAITTVCPAATIDVVASVSNQQIAARYPGVRRAIAYDRSLGGMIGIRRALHDTAYDLVFAPVMNKTTLSGLLANILGGRRAVTVAFEHQERRDLYASWFNIQVPVERNVRTMGEMLVGMVERVFGRTDLQNSMHLRLPISDDHRARANAFVHGLRSRRIAVNISSSNPYRMWSEDRNTVFVHALHRALPEHDIIVLGHGERQSMAERIAASCGDSVHAYHGSSDLVDVAALLELCDVVVTPDTSVVHVAAAVSRPVVVMYSLKASFIQEWLPFGVPYRCVMTKGRADLETIDPHDVVEAVRDLLHAIGSSL